MAAWSLVMHSKWRQFRDNWEPFRHKWGQFRHKWEQRPAAMLLISLIAKMLFPAASASRVSTWPPSPRVSKPNRKCTTQNAPPMYDTRAVPPL
eukprot:1671943-Rhodomonas_salina.4